MTRWEFASFEVDRSGDGLYVSGFAEFSSNQTVALVTAKFDAAGELIWSKAASSTGAASTPVVKTILSTVNGGSDNRFEATQRMALSHPGNVLVTQAQFYHATLAD